MLFADIVGSTELGERHDPELVQSLVAPAFDRLSAEVRRYEGLTEKFVGDAVLALFGVPVAHEDDAERAVRAALEMQRVMREPLVEGFVGARLELRIGIELGEVLVDLPRAARDRDRMVTGDVVNLAARLEQAALPGTVVVGPAIRAATRDLVEYEPLEPILAKGKSEPISAWRAVAVTATRGRPSPFGRESALIGRQAELTALKDAIAQSVAQGRPQLVTILGTAGIGKSRLAWELEKYLDGLPEAYRWLKGRCLAYGQTSYSALAEVLKLDLELLDDDPSEAASVTIERRLEELDLVDADGTIGAALRATLALEPSTGLTREDLFEAWRRYLEVAAGDSPLVLVLEDLHWADEGLLDFVEFLGRWGRASIAIVCLARRELVERRPTWGEGIAQARRIVLDRLSDHEITALVHSLFDEPLPPALIGRVSSAAEGNPLFTEELIRAVVDEQGSREVTLAVARLTVPDSIHAVLAARLDNLPRAERRLAHDASVIGRFFWDGAVAHLDGGDRSRVHDRLDALAAKELIIPREPSSLAGESEFGFRHVLIRDVAYETLPKRERAAKHRLVAEWAEVRFAGRLDEVVELLASHYASALEYQAVLASSKESELEPLRHKTLEFARRAGQRAAGLWQLELATRWTRLAVEQGRRLGIPPQELAVLILEYLEASAGYEPVDALLAASEEALELLDQPRDPGSTAVSERTRVRLRARVGIQRADAQYFAGAPVLARAALEDALAQLDDGHPTPERARVLARLGRMLNVTGGHVEARPYLRRAIAEAEATGNREAERWAIHDLGLYSQDKTEGIALMERSLELARAAGDRFLLARCYTNLPFLIGEVAGDWHRAIAISREGAEEAQRAGDRGTLGRVRQNLASFLAWIGPVDEALRLAEAAVRDSAAVGHQAHVDAEFRDLAYMRLSMGDRSGALSDLERAPDVGPHDQPPIRVFDAYLRSLIRWADNPEGAVRDLADALRRADEPDDQAARWLVRMAARTGQVSDGNVGLKMAQDIEGSQPTPFHRLSRAWAEALLVVPPSDAAGQLDGVSAELHATGFPLPAADASCDAALMAGRAGLLDHERIRRAREGYAGSRAVPMLGPMPETRWIDAAVAARSGE